MLGFLKPERLSSAGVWIAPAAQTTARERIVTLAPLGWWVAVDARGRAAGDGDRST